MEFSTELRYKAFDAARIEPEERVIEGTPTPTLFTFSWPAVKFVTDDVIRARSENTTHI